MLKPGVTEPEADDERGDAGQATTDLPQADFAKKQLKMMVITLSNIVAPIVYSRWPRLFTRPSDAAMSR